MECHKIIGDDEMMETIKEVVKRGKEKIYITDRENRKRKQTTVDYAIILLKIENKYSLRASNTESGYIGNVHNLLIQKISSYI